jgi:mRNA-degrading endonuclease RelE of RelBE toxin-antitoxin system
VGLRAGPSSGIIARAPRDVTILEAALRALLDLTAVERQMVATQVDRLAMDALPHGVQALEGRHRDHLRLRIGRFRLLYRVVEGELTVVAILAD